MYLIMHGLSIHPSLRGAPKDGYFGWGGVGAAGGHGPGRRLTDWPGTGLVATAAEIDLAGKWHTAIMRCRIVFFCKTGCGRVDLLKGG